MLLHLAPRQEKRNRLHENLELLCLGGSSRFTGISFHVRGSSSFCGSLPVFRSTANG
jgi:hypothetical protein